MTTIRVGDAFVRSCPENTKWTIGTKAVEMTFDVKGGLFRLVGFRNKLTKQPQDYSAKITAIEPFTFSEDGAPLILSGASAMKTDSGGQPVAMLILDFVRQALKIRFHVVAFPGTSVLRQWISIENAGTMPVPVAAKPLALSLVNAPENSFTHYWMVGGNSKPDQGMMKNAVVSADYVQLIQSNATNAFMPWMALHRNESPQDGFFIAMEYLGNWSLSVERQQAGTVLVSAGVTDLSAVSLNPGQKIDLPVTTIGAFAGTLDDMSMRSYDWQYRYLWDKTNMDYYARPKWAVPWFYCARNVQEQFAERLAFLDMHADLMRSMGFEMLWDDAGWSVPKDMPQDNYMSVFTDAYEGPDFRQTFRYLEKMDMRWLAWFARRPSSGVMTGKVGAWGNFEWRTDDVHFPDWAADRDMREKIRQFVEGHPGCSFHTCSLGSTYSHTFDIQRYANTNYFADFGRGPQTNYYFSYVEPPDKWVDIIEPWGTKGAYSVETARQLLTMVPFWGLKASPSDQVLIRRDLELYRYLLRAGVAGRWSYMFHPAVKGDEEFYYAQRTRYDRKQACIILKHKAPGPVTISPRGLLPDHRYQVEFDLSPVRTERLGDDLMANGILIQDQVPGDLIHLNLPHRPGSGRDKVPPTAPGTVLSRREANIGHSGVALYWSPGTDDHWLSGYEVRRGDTILGKVCMGTTYFDHSAGWDPGARYAVRSMDGDGNVSSWTESSRLADEPGGACALGGLFPERGREGWCADTTVDGVTYVPMQWVNPPKTASADEGGTPNQPGGVEGCWEGQGGARLGRAWMQASKEACCVRTWIVPESGSVNVVGRVMKEWYRQTLGGDIAVRVLHNDQLVWPDTGWATAHPNDLVGVLHDLTLAVKQGDFIRFIVGKSADPENDIAAWMPRITYSEPDSANRSESVIRILAGAAKSYMDQSGNIWSKDLYFRGGRAATGTREVQGGDDPVLYQRGRQGLEFSYAIPVEKGLYAVRLKFAEPKYEWSFFRPFNVEINGREQLCNFDICHAARGSRKAHDRVFRYIVPNAEGQIVLRFSSGFEPGRKTGPALVNAIEVVPEIKPIVRINCGGTTDFIDWNSFVWSADGGFAGGCSIESSLEVIQASPTLYDQALYQTARSGRLFSYALSLPPGLYTVHLKFAELWLKDPGKRPMDIAINGRTIWNSWDPGRVAGQVGMAIDLRALNITPDKTGTITVSVRAAGENDAILQGIEVE